ncbi:unnamed protein product [Thlaspi arvense]|uniref:Uncharacterized protein n=1 Tax=Thlaspi arvense TaxID=13288 RepID=A0AAU9SCV8_THLAR|nr:unnamed protein product [Thlaspi arvense]
MKYSLCHIQDFTRGFSAIISRGCIKKPLCCNHKDSRDIFYSFHRDEVFAESVKDDCAVYFVLEKKQVPNHGFIVQRVYNTENKKLRKFTHHDFTSSKIKRLIFF